MVGKWWAAPTTLSHDTDSKLYLMVQATATVPGSTSASASCLMLALGRDYTTIPPSLKVSNPRVCHSHSQTYSIGVGPMTAETIVSTVVRDDMQWRTGWVRYIQRVYGFDLATAQRVVFYRWLAESGRLRDG
jgi:hypothetical protein